MKVFHSIAEWLEFRRGDGFSQAATLGFVPTMGALHEGHVSLFKKSCSENDFTAASIFVNPTQFNDANDFKNYPITLEDDLAQLERAGVDFVLLPDKDQIYPDGYRYRITESEFSHVLCGAHRPGHFDGVLTVVLKLLQIADATRAYFGEKDYQQYLLIKEMAKAFFLKTEILSSPTVRETDGLALSSRNRRLTPEQRAKAPEIYRTLKTATNAAEAARILTTQGFEVEYLEERLSRRFVAAKLGDVRLIDNVGV